jgi:hypothetical protein
MTRLNLAYETARGYISAQDGAPADTATTSSYTRSRATGATPARGEAPGDDAERRWAARPGRPFESEASPSFVRELAVPWQRVVDGVYVYYQYGLENVHLRREGVRRFRYRQALKSIKDGIAALDPLTARAAPDVESRRLEAARGFSKAFLQNMLIEKYYIPTRLSTERKAYGHYDTGSRYLDQAIKYRFCREFMRPGDLPASSGTLQVVQHELMTVIAKYTESTWVPESMIKMHLLDRFTAAVEASLSA